MNMTQGRLELLDLIEERDKLVTMHSGSWTNETRDHFQRITDRIAVITSYHGASLGTISGKGRRYADSVLNDIHNQIQIDMFADTR